MGVQVLFAVKAVLSMSIVKPVPTTNPPATVTTPADSVIIDGPRDVGESALTIELVVCPVIPPVLDVPQITVSGLTEEIFK